MTELSETSWMNIRTQQLLETQHQHSPCQVMPCCLNNLPNTTLPQTLSQPATFQLCSPTCSQAATSSQQGAGGTAGQAGFPFGIFSDL